MNARALFRHTWPKYTLALTTLLLVPLVAVPMTSAQLGRAELVALVPAALSPDPAVSDSARKQLRAAGQDGLEALFVTHAESINAMRSKRPFERSDTERRLREAMDSVAQQLDVEYSRLYWYTDLEHAKREAQRLNRPILSLRMLGKLTEELSCANSRFFRTSLYSNPAVAELMRQRFILHWSTERPVPKMTIDFGDGRTLRTTVTGNSIHYILDSKGRLFDGLPGLYTPSHFRRTLEQSLSALSAVNSERSDSAFIKHRASFHRAAIQRLNAQLAQVRASERPAQFRLEDTLQPAVAFSKSLWEQPTLKAVAAPAGRVPSVVDELAAWEPISLKLVGEPGYEPPALELMERKFTMPVGFRPSSSGSLRSLLLRAFRKNVVTESARNEYSTHLALHQHLESAPTPSIETSNDFVYAVLFGMPRSDRWIGLLNEEVFSGIESYGLEVDRSPNSLETFAQ